jgi:hypothetical protein
MSVITQGMFILFQVSEYKSTTPICTCQWLVYAVVPVDPIVRSKVYLR